ncbi:MAG: 16S rRNA (guanine(527)-N(7))-methyltransferase RsmG [Clostridia bacterium]|nr:16S rRNA (guanine(527)-N(7))-methyltransferase RsmG [Clostridia bacterium]
MSTISIPHDEFISYLTAALEQNGMPTFAADTELKENLYVLTVRMLEVNEHMNLTTIREPRDIIMRHYVDSLSVASYIPVGATVLDIGCGAGFPCLPLALARPDLHITAIDSTEKKIRYVSETAALLGIPANRLNARALRAEEGGSVGGELREKFNIVVSRAVARLSVLGELALPCLCIGGQLLALKGEKAEEEVTEAKGLRILGATEARIIPTPLTPPDGRETDRHALVMIGKQEKTPRIYPRKYAQILKKPL